MISIRGLTKSYGGRLVLDSLNLDFERGVVYVLRGQSGSGKSTFLNIIAGYACPNAGFVKCGESVGYLMQDELLFSKLRVAELLQLRFLGLLASGAHSSLESFWLEASRWLDTLGLARLVDSEVSTLSGGERRRLEIASIMLANPGVLLMDEPTSGLDPRNAEAVYSAIWEVRGSRTVVIATHEVSIPGLPESSHELWLDQGKVREGCAKG